MNGRVPAHETPPLRPRRSNGRPRSCSRLSAFAGKLLTAKEDLCAGGRVLGLDLSFRDHVLRSGQGPFSGLAATEAQGPKFSGGASRAIPSVRSRPCDPDAAMDSWQATPLRAGHDHEWCEESRSSGREPLVAPLQGRFLNTPRTVWESPSTARPRRRQRCARRSMPGLWPRRLRDRGRRRGCAAGPCA